MKKEIEREIFKKMKAKDFGETMCNKTKLNVLRWTMRQLNKYDVVGQSKQLSCGTTCVFYNDGGNVQYCKAPTT
jgi:hypothetical protein